MIQAEYTEISREIVYSDLWEDKEMFCIFIELLLERDCETNSTEILWDRVIDHFDIPKDVAKKKLFKLKKLGYIELYKASRKWKVIVAFRRNDDLYKISDFELFLDKNLIVDLPKSYVRNDVGYGKFCKEVLKRDNYTCQICGSKENLEVHHKKSYAKYARLRTAVSNGITLCQKCHDKVHSKEVDIVE